MVQRKIHRHYNAPDAADDGSVFYRNVEMEQTLQDRMSFQTKDCITNCSEV